MFDVAQAPHYPETGMKLAAQKKSDARHSVTPPRMEPGKQAWRLPVRHLGPMKGLLTREELYDDKP